VECPELVTRVREHFKNEIEGGARTVIPGDLLSIDFARSAAVYRGETFRFAALGSVPQALVVAGGVENLVRRRLGLA
jgi:hypothetical protein